MSGRPRISTLVLIGLFVAVYATYFLVRPGNAEQITPPPVPSPTPSHTRYTPRPIPFRPSKSATPSKSPRPSHSPSPSPSLIPSPAPSTAQPSTGQPSTGQPSTGPTLGPAPSSQAAPAASPS